jgi:hypothetical protein
MIQKLRELRETTEPRPHHTTKAREEKAPALVAFNNSKLRRMKYLSRF